MVSQLIEQGPWKVFWSVKRLFVAAGFSQSVWFGEARAAEKRFLLLQISRIAISH